MGHSPRHTSSPLSRELASEVAEVMQALATSSRVMILDRLRLAPCSVGELSLAVAMEQSAVSHQLRLLRYLGLVVSERQGKRMIYALHDLHVGELLEEAIGHAEHVRLAQHRGAGVEAP